MTRNARADCLFPAVLALCTLCACMILIGAAGKSDSEPEITSVQTELQTEANTDTAAAGGETEAARSAQPLALLSQTAQTRVLPVSYSVPEPSEPAQQAVEPDEPAQSEQEASETMTSLPQPPAEPMKSADGRPIVAVPNGDADVPDNLELIDTFVATAYCVTGTTSTGTYTTINRTLAVNPRIIPYGTHVWMFLDDGTLVGDFYAEDTGSNMLANPYVVDIYMGPGTYNDCILWGAQHVTLYAEPEADAADGALPAAVQPIPAEK